MNTRMLLIPAMIITVAIPLSANAKKKAPERGMLEKMDAVTCGAKQRGVAGLGTFWASAGLTHVDSDEKLCPQYLLRTDQDDYEIRPTDKHPALLPVGHEASFTIKKNEMFVKALSGSDQKIHSYEVVSIQPAPSDNSATSSDNEDPKASSESSDHP